MIHGTSRQLANEWQKSRLRVHGQGELPQASMVSRGLMGESEALSKAPRIGRFLFTRRWGKSLQERALQQRLKC